MFITGWPKSAVRGCKQNFSRENFIGVSATNSWEKSSIFWYGLPEDFLSIGQKTSEQRPPPHMDQRVNYNYTPNALIQYLVIFRRGSVLYEENRQNAFRMKSTDCRLIYSNLCLTGLTVLTLVNSYFTQIKYS